MSVDWTLDNQNCPVFCTFHHIIDRPDPGEGFDDLSARKLCVLPGAIVAKDE